MKKKRVIAWIMAAAMTFAPSATYADLVETPQGETSPSEAVETIANEEAEYELGEPHEEPVYELDAPDAQGTTDDETVYELDEPDVQIAADESTDAASPKASASDMAEVVMDDGSATTYSDAQSLLNAVASYSGKTFTIKLHSNVPTTNAGMFKIPSNSKVTLDLNGFSINRHKANADYDTDDDWEVMIVYENANLTIEDSDPTRWHGGYLDGAKGQKIWFENDASTGTPIEGGIIAGGASENGAGGITIKNNATVTMKGGTIAGNYAGSGTFSYNGGGGVQLRNSGSKFILDGGRIMYNGAYKNNGGGIDNEEGIVEIISGDVSYNWAYGGATNRYGGGIYINHESDRALYIHGSNTSADGKEKRSVNISNNYAEDEGGGIYIDEGTSTILNAAITYNKCDDGDGAGILINDDGTSGSLTAVTGCYIASNTASGDGGGIAITDENYVQIANCVIRNNTAGDEGGGIYFNAYGDGCSISGCEVTNNTAKRNGGGIHIYDTVAIGGKMIVKNNSANDGRNNLYNYGYVSTPNLKIADLSVDSELYIHSDWNNDEVVTEGTTTGSAKGMFGEGDYHFEKINDPTSSNYRKIVQKSGKAEPQKPEEVDAWANVNKEQTATATNLGYTMQIDKSKGDVNGAPVYRGYLRFADAMKSIEGYYHTMNYYYSDGLFFTDPTDYNKHLASLTASLTMASGAASKGITTVLDPATQTNRFNYLTQVFSDIGCTNESMYVNDCYQRKPEKDTMGVAMANKVIYKNNVTTDDNARLLIPIFVRSYNYGPEWISNFTLGDGTTHNGEAEGFSSSADIVMADLDKYIGSHPEVQSAISGGKAIFWLGGYSRGGAVTNLVAKRVTDRYTGGKNGTSTGNTVFAYCKSAAQGAVENLDKEGGYLNIHNIINKSDIVTYVGPNEMGLKRYGVDHYLPGGEAGKVKKTTKTYGPSDKPLTIYSDNNDYEVDYNNSDYLQLRKKFIGQLAAIMPDLEFNDYFSAAEVNYFWGNDYTSWIPIFGEDMITEAEYAPLSTKAKFCQEFWARLLRYSSNTQNAGHNITSTTSSKDYREFYTNNKNGHFMEGSRYHQQGCASLQEALSTIMGIAMGGEVELDFSNMVDLTDTVADIALDVYDELIGDLYDDNTPQEYTEWIDKIWGLLTGDLTDEQKGKGYKNLKDILGDDIEKANAVYPTLVAMALDLVNDDYNDTDKGQYLLGTLAYNANDIVNDHLVNIAWIRADDDWYAGDVDKVYAMNIEASVPDKPGAWLSAAEKGKAETAITEGTTAEASTTQKLYLRTQPGGAVYYTMKVNGEETASDVLYQGAEGITLPADKTVEITTYAKAYEQKSDEAIYTVKVVPRIAISKANVTGINAKYVYSGKLKKPAPVVKYNGTKLVRGTDYTVAYRNNKNVGTAKVIITGKGEYTGKTTKTFKIIPKGTSIKKLQGSKKAISVTWKKQSTKMSASHITGYQIQVATNNKFTKGKKTVSVKGFGKTSRKITKLKAGKKYWVRIRTYKKVSGKTYYSKWSKAKAVKTK